MADRRKRTGGRVTPPAGSGPPSSTPRAQRRIRWAGPNRPVEGPVQAGRRPSNPATLFLIAATWIGCGIVALVGLTASWKLIPGIVFIGVGVLFLRGALATVARRGDADKRPGGPGR